VELASAGTSTNKEVAVVPNSDMRPSVANGAPSARGTPTSPDGGGGDGGGSGDNGNDASLGNSGGASFVSSDSLALLPPSKKPSRDFLRAERAAAVTAAGVEASAVEGASLCMSAS